MNTSDHATPDIAHLLERMKLAQQSQGFVPAALRIDRLHRLMRLLQNNVEEFCATLNADFGQRSRETTLMNDILATFSSMKYARSQVPNWMRQDQRAGVFPFNLFGARVEVRHDPKGVIGILGTWNVPLFTSLAPLASVLAAGNRAMIKPSEHTPQTAALLARLVADFFDEDELAVVNGGVEVSTAFSQLHFDHIVLTGSARIGRSVMRAAADKLVPVTLELGGKSPVLIGKSASIEKAAHRIVLGKTMNAGQICVTPDTVYLPENKLEEFIHACVREHQAMYPTGAQDSGITSIINASHQQRLEKYLQELASRQVRVIACGRHVTDTAEAIKQKCWPLHLVISPPADSSIAQDEIFGPLLQIETYSDIRDAVSKINAGDLPLALYYFGHDAQEERWVLDSTRSGGVTINDVLIHVAAHDAPFGGVGASGMGKYHGKEGFLEFSHARTVYRSGWWDPRKTFGLVPPYSEKVFSQLRKSIR